MKFTIFLLLFVQIAHAEFLRVRPRNVEQTHDAGSEALVQELLTFGQTFPALKIEDGYLFFDRAHILFLEREPAVYSLNEIVSGSRVPKYRVTPGKVFIGANFYENETAIDCGVASQGMGGYDLTNPFSSGSMAYLFLVPDGEGFNCVIGANTQLSSSWNYLFKRLATITHNSFGVTNIKTVNSVTTSSGQIFVVGGTTLPRTTSCMAIEIDYHPKRHGFYGVFIDNMDYATLAVYDNSCGNKLYDLDFYFDGAQIRGTIPVGILYPGTHLYLMGTLKSNPGSQTTYFSASINRFHEITQ